MAQDLQTDGQWEVVTLFLDFSITRRQDLYLEHVKVKVPEREEYCSSGNRAVGLQISCPGRENNLESSRKKKSLK